MALARSYRLFWSLPARRRWRLAEAFAFLGFASFLIWCLPFRSVMRIAAAVPSLPGSRKPDAGTLIADLRWALEAWARRVPWRAVCFQKGLAFHMMLRLRGIASVLHYGVKQSLEKGLEAHVWVTHGADPVIGAEAAQGFACLASVPAPNR
jgi:hypothetical protein